MVAPVWPAVHGCHAAAGAHEPCPFEKASPRVINSPSFRPQTAQRFCWRGCVRDGQPQVPCVTEAALQQECNHPQPQVWALRQSSACLSQRTPLFRSIDSSWRFQIPSTTREFEAHPGPRRADPRDAQVQ